MCLIISIVAGIFAFNAFMNGSIILAFGSTIVSIFFIYLMINNILHVRKIREENNDN